MKTALIALILCVPCMARNKECREFSAQSLRDIVVQSSDESRADLNPLNVSFVEKRIARLGDDAAVILAQGFTEEQLLEPGHVKSVIAILRLAFSNREAISNDQHKRPRVALLLIQRLISEEMEPEVKRALQDLKIELETIP
jgi:hypothetical protein